MSNQYGNLGGMMKQAQKMYQAVQKAQEELAEKRIEASSGGGMVTATVTGKSELVSIKIDPQVVDPDDIEMLEDLVVTAVREAAAQATKEETELLQGITGGMNMPGMF